MKKFTKGCLLTALGLFIFGCVLCGICGVMGGFRQLDNIDENGLSVLDNQFDWVWMGIFDGDEWDIDSPGMKTLEASESAQTDYLAGDIRAIDIELGMSNLVIQESEDDAIWIQNDSSNKTKVKYGMSNGTFKLYNKRSYRFWNVGRTPRGSVYLYLPAGMDLNSIDIEMGAGNAESIALWANEIDLEAGAGNFTIEGLMGRDISISVGAGKADIAAVDAKEFSIEAGAGDIRLQNMSVNSLDLEAAAGSIEAAGRIDGDADIECAAGSVDLELEGEETDYDYEIECAAGSVKVGSNEYSGLASERSIDNHSAKEMRIECAAGGVEIRFGR
ncbi:MAG: DUF4097 domain-containing protein [Blautia sp.]|nr:DUF4097 domain-containing protein [Lachnoclostridium sp.]MCM1211622.1 DUF4097 domain-containing protein [Blautia sp.]